MVGNSIELLDRLSPERYHIVLTIYLEVSSATVMMTKRRNYTITEKLKIIERVKNGKSKASLFHQCKIPEGTICT
jgi:hypothetical protein